MSDVFKKLNAVNVNGYVEQKNGLSYVSWSYAWQETKKLYPEATYEIVKFNGIPYVYDENTGYMVYTKVTIEGITHEMWLPVMDGANKAMKAQPYTYKTRAYDKETRSYKEVEKTVQAATMFDVNKTIMRCLVKNLAMFGLGLYIYAGEDLPEEEAKAKANPYPDRNGMIEAVKKDYEDQAKLLEYYKVKKIEDLKDAQLMALYNRKHPVGK